ncbi:DUF4394 domain-containing protein [Chitinophaga sp. W2I13]|uniref:DUF4394 domain-containing protein n=1 Tax=Chitinophaga sp. W2I13 TaxID=3373923 RepID=UPI003D1A7388
MKLYILVALGLFSLTTNIACKKSKKEDKPVINAFATSGNNLLSFNLNSPATASAIPITGLLPGETIVGMDIRPANNQLYAVGSTSRLYRINTSTGAATPVNASPFAEVLNGTAFGVDFNPSVDRLRIVSNTGQNLRIHPENGTLVAKDTDINPPGSGISAVAYSNNTAGSASTVLYDIGYASNSLYRQDPPNGGAVILVGRLGIGASESNGFDISGASNKAYALFTEGGITKLYAINLETGAATAVGDFPAPVKGLAIALNL